MKPISSIRHKNLIFLLSFLFINSCTLISAGNVVKNKFTPALLKADVNKVADQSTKSFAKVMKLLKNKDLKTLLILGGVSSSDSSSSYKKTSKKTKMPSIKLISFDSSGNKAVLVAGQGKTRYIFLMKKQNGDWKVDNLIIKGGGKKIDFRAVVGIYAAYKDVFKHIKQNKLPKNRLSYQLQISLEPVLFEISNLTNKFSSSEKNKKTTVSKQTADIIKGFDFKSSRTSAHIQFYFSFGKAIINLSRKKDFWKFEQIILAFKGKKPLHLSFLLKETAPAIRFYAKLPEILNSKTQFCSNLSADLKPIFDFDADFFTNIEKTCLLAPETFRSTLKKLVFERKKHTQTSLSKKHKKENSSNPIVFLNKISWKKVQNAFVINYKGKSNFIIKLSFEGKIRDFSLKSKSIQINAETFKKAGNLFASLYDFKQYPRNPMIFFSSDLQKRVIPYIPKKLKFSTQEFNKIKAFFNKIKVPSPEKINTRKKNSRIPKFKLIEFIDTPNIIKILMLYENHPVNLKLIKENNKLKISSFFFKNQDLTLWLYILPPIMRLYSGIRFWDAEALSETLADETVYKTFYSRKHPRKINILKNGLKRFFKIYGKYLSILRNKTLEILLQRISEKQKSTQSATLPPTKQTAILNVPFISSSKNKIIIVYKNSKFQFNKKHDGSFGFMLPTSSKTSPFNPDFIGFIPVLATYYTGLALNDTKGPKAFSTYVLKRKLWKKLKTSDLKRIKKKFGISISLPEAEDIANTILPLKKQENTSDETQKKSDLPHITGYILKTRRRWPFAEIWLYADGKNTDLVFSWDKHGKLWLFDDLKTEVPVIFGKKIKVSIRNLGAFLK